VSDPTWLSYAAVITGIIGAVTGVVGAILGYIGYRRTEQLKALDLRVELRKLLVDLHSRVAEFPELLELAKRSRTRVASATGMYQSGAMEKWLADWDSDRMLERDLRAQLPEAGQSYLSASQTDLEASLIRLHALRAQVVGLHDKYMASLAADDKKRDHLREDMRVRTQTRPDGKA
jgi:hypothetical protein